METPHGLQIRCFCKHHPMLAVGGRDAKGKPFIHVKVYKAKRIYTQVIVTSGVVRIQCRECERWHRIRIVEMAFDVKDEPLPTEISIPS